LESQYPNRIRYLTIVSAFGQDEEEQSIIMGVDWTDKYVKHFLCLLTLMPETPVLCLEVEHSDLILFLAVCWNQFQKEQNRYIALINYSVRVDCPVQDVY